MSFEPLPISVVVIHDKRHEERFISNCLPQIRENNPAEIIIEDGDGTLLEKRKAAIEKVTQPYLMFVDDQYYLYEFALSEMYRALIADPEAAFSCCDLYGLYPRVNGSNVCMKRRGRVWMPDENGHYVETMGVMRRPALDNFDPSPGCVEPGQRGIYIARVLFELHHFSS